MTTVAKKASQICLARTTIVSFVGRHYPYCLPRGRASSRCFSHAKQPGISGVGCRRRVKSIPECQWVSARTRVTTVSKFEKWFKIESTQLEVYVHFTPGDTSRLGESQVALPSLNASVHLPRFIESEALVDLFKRSSAMGILMMHFILSFTLT